MTDCCTSDVEEALRSSVADPAGRSVRTDAGAGQIGPTSRVTSPCGDTRWQLGVAALLVRRIRWVSAVRRGKPLWWPKSWGVRLRRCRFWVAPSWPRRFGWLCAADPLAALARAIRCTLACP